MITNQDNQSPINKPEIKTVKNSPRKPERKPSARNNRNNNSRNGSYSRNPKKLHFSSGYHDGPSEKVTVTETMVKIIPLGGVEEMGKNMILLEQGDDIIVIDMGVQMPGNDQPGIDYIIPNTTYLKEHEKKIRGIILTSSHYDHIGAVPYIMQLLPSADVYATKPTFSVLESRQNYFLKNMSLNKRLVQSGDSLQLGSFKVDIFRINHNVPGTIGLAISTYQGKILYIADFKFDYNPVNELPADIGKLADLTHEGVFALMLGSVGAEQEGYAKSERTIGLEIEEIIKETEGKVIFATFSSMLNRLQQMVDGAEKNGRQIFIEGRSILNSFNNARRQGFLQVKKGTIIGTNQLSQVENKNLIVICSGAHNDDIPHFMRITNNEHPLVKIQEGDAVMFSSASIPGNERSAQKVMDNLAKQGAVIHHVRSMDVYSGAHAQREDLKIMLNIVKPQYVIPIHGPHYLLNATADVSRIVGYNDNHIIIPKNGNVLAFDNKSFIKNKERVTVSHVMVDGLGVGDLREVVIRDRQMLAQDGILHIVVILDSKKNAIFAGPYVISKGFVYIKESKDLIEEAKAFVSVIAEAKLKEGQEIDVAYLRDEIREQLGQFLFTKTERRPMILPVILEV